MPGGLVRAWGPGAGLGPVWGRSGAGLGQEAPRGLGEASEDREPPRLPSYRGLICSP